MEITPRSFGAILAEAINALARVWKPLLWTALLTFVPVGIIALLVFRTSGAADFIDLLARDPGYVDGLSEEAMRELAIPLLWAGGVTLALQIIASIYVYLVSHLLIAAHLAGEPITGKRARGEALSRYGVALVAGILTIVAVVVLIGLGFVIWFVPYTLVGTPNATSFLVATILFFALVGPGVWVGVSLSMLTPVVALEKGGIVGSMRRSVALVRRRWWSTLGYLLLVGLLGMAAIQLIQIVAFPLAAVAGANAGNLVVAGIGVVAQGLIVAALGAMYTLWYLDLRARFSEDPRPGS